MPSEWLKIGYISNEVKRRKYFRHESISVMWRFQGGNKADDRGSLIAVSEMSDRLGWSASR